MCELLQSEREWNTNSYWSYLLGRAFPYCTWLISWNYHLPLSIWSLSNSKSFILIEYWCLQEKQSYNNSNSNNKEMMSLNAPVARRTRWDLTAGSRNDETKRNELRFSAVPYNAAATVASSTQPSHRTALSTQQIRLCRTVNLVTVLASVAVSLTIYPNLMRLGGLVEILEYMKPGVMNGVGACSERGDLDTRSGAPSGRAGGRRTVDTQASKHRRKLGTIYVALRLWRCRCLRSHRSRHSTRRSMALVVSYC